MIKEIILLEEQHQKFQQRYSKNQLEAAVAKLKIIDANKIAKEITCANQKYFEFANKPGTFLAKLITLKEQNNAITALKNKKGVEIRVEKDKHEDFRNYYQQLYA